MLIRVCPDSFFSYFYACLANGFVFCVYAYMRAHSTDKYKTSKP